MSCSPILDCQLAAIQAQTATMLVDSVTVKRKTAAATEPDGAGGRKPVTGDGWEVIATINGLLTPVPQRSPSERSMGNQIKAAVDHYVYVAHGTDIKTEDRLLIGSRSFDVQGVPKAEAMAVLDQVNCVELQK